MITIFHGDDTVSSRKQYILERETKTNPVAFDAEKLDITDLIQAVDGSGLFIDSVAIFIENLFSKSKPGKANDVITSYLLKTNAAIFLWEEKLLTKKQLGIFPKANVKEYKLAQGIFQFLDTLQPQNQKTLLALFHKALQNADAEFIFYMLTRQIRLLLAILDTKASETIDEVVKLAPWQKGKLQKQANSFSKKHLVLLLEKLYEIDKSQKTGATPLTLTQSIDMFLLSDI